MVFEVDPSLQNPDDLKTEEGLATARDEYAKKANGPSDFDPCFVGLYSGFPHHDK